jgi:hypothetical protein
MVIPLFLFTYAASLPERMLQFQDSSLHCHFIKIRIYKKNENVNRQAEMLLNGLPIS